MIREAGRNRALWKLGFVLPALSGTAVGSLGGYLLAPEDRKFQGATRGALLGAIGGGAGSLITPIGGTAVGSLAGTGLSQIAINKDLPHTSEDPYQYSEH